MATFLQLCARLTTRSGVIGTAPVAVTGQTGRQAKCVDWIEQAYEIIQSLHPDWSFLQGTWSSSLTIGQTTYTAAQLGIASRFGEWAGDRRASGRDFQPVTLYLTATGVSNEGPLREISFEQWMSTYDRGTQVAGRPLYYCRAPDDTLRFGPKPDAAYTARGQYRKAPQILAANGDIPECPDRFHDAIVYRAMMLADEDDEAPAPVGMTRARLRYDDLLYAMRRDCLPRLTVGSRP